jgi:hypothetical protein
MYSILYVPQYSAVDKTSKVAFCSSPTPFLFFLIVSQYRHTQGDHLFYRKTTNKKELGFT